jgi:hypothetical protein
LAHPPCNPSPDVVRSTHKPREGKPPARKGNTMSITAEAVKFEVGQTYATRAMSDWDTVYSFTVVKRTARFVTLDCGYGEVKRVGVYEWDGVEKCKPHGTYSMCAVLSADKAGVLS